MELVQKLHDEIIMKANAEVAKQMAEAPKEEEPVAVGVTPVEAE